eukprot:TRINITY_DN11386_c0_g1_i3.p1 TRINITY_DN11386_c0_g1~~TRINITY_DN11386_c0_g1_i3.p1  ORF type:complete len:869 (+),score=165.12 TRINITY_DN11386_c0_g1_i3:161-2767(+)
MASSRRRRRPQLGKETPFYEQHKVAADVQERVLQRTRNAVRTVETSRPFTPADSNRGLFGVSGRSSSASLFEGSERAHSARPPSAFPMGRQQFLAEMPETDDLGRPATAAMQRPSTRSKPLSATAPAPSSHRTQPKPPERPRTRSANSRQAPRPPQRSRTTSGGRTRRAMPAPPDQSQATSTDDSTTARPASRRGLPQPPSEHVAPSRSLPIPAPEPASSAARPSSDLARAMAGPVTTDPNQIMASPRRNSTSASQGRVSSAHLADIQRWELVEPLLLELEPTRTTDQLYTTVDALAKLLNKSFRSGKRNAAVLRSLYRLLDSKDTCLLVRVLKLVLTITQKGATLANACKLLFKLSRSADNDSILREEGAPAMLLGVLNSTSTADNLETLVYCCGALKNLTSNAATQDQMLDTGILKTIKRHLDACLAQDFQVSSSKQLTHLVVQSTAALRNMAAQPKHIAAFADSGILTTVGELLLRFKEKDLALNVARVFGKVTLQQSGRDAVLTTPGVVGQLTRLLELYPKSKVHCVEQALIIRIYFVLGNLVAADEDTRQSVMEATDQGTLLMAQFERYTSKLLKWADTAEEKEEANDGAPVEEVDVVVKLVRLLANLAISDICGDTLAQDQRWSSLLPLLEHPVLSRQEELVMNLAGAINNLSFHHVDPNCILNNRLPLARALVPQVLSSSMDLVAEVCRVYGTFSQLDSVRHLLIEERVHELLVVLLAHDNREVVFTSCGILMNLAADIDCRQQLSGHEMVDSLIEVILSCEHVDWQLAGTGCKALWNYLTGLEAGMKDGSYTERITMELMEDLVEVLTELTEPQAEPKDELSNDLYHAEFQPVAQHLCSMLTTCVELGKQASPESKFEPL